MRRFSTGMFAGLVLLALNATAQDLHFDDYRKFLMNGSGAKSTKKMAVETTCTNSAGEITRIGETQYDVCLTEVRSQADQKILTGKEGARGSASPSVGTSIHIGN